MLKIEQRTGNIKDFVEKIYGILGCSDARVSAIFIQGGNEIQMTSLDNAEPAMVTVDDSGKVEILLRKSNLYLKDMMFNLLKGLIKCGMKESSYQIKEEIIRGDFVFLVFTF